ncbi:unnamed protein product [Laminaria digitata]
MEVLGKFDTMRRMMIALGDQPSLLSKLPGFDQLAQVRKVRGLDLAELFGDAFELPAEPVVEDIPLDQIPEPERKRKEYFSGMAVAAPPKKSNKDKLRKKKQAAKRARKKNRR